MNHYLKNKPSGHNRPTGIPSWVDLSLFPDATKRLTKENDEWKTSLTEIEFRVLREEGTEYPFANEYFDTETEGVYICRGCCSPLFSSLAKYHSGTGWPSFWEPLRQEHIETRPDNKLGAQRTEVLCSRCRGHLGHVFEDGPPPTGLRYCLNSASIRLIDRDSHEKIASGRLEELPFRLNL